MSKVKDQEMYWSEWSEMPEQQQNELLEEMWLHQENNRLTGKVKEATNNLIKENKKLITKICDLQVEIDMYKRILNQNGRL